MIQLQFLTKGDPESEIMWQWGKNLVYRKHCIIIFHADRAKATHIPEGIILKSQNLEIEPIL